ncbi:hypothetical protein Drorol1_Dr00017829 [Drosera rotundifolia]
MSRLKRALTRPWRTEPTYVAKYGDDLWLGVKGQPRSDIAGSPRNLFQRAYDVDGPRVEAAREQSVPPCHSRESVYSRDCCHSQQGRLGFQEKTSNWEGDPPGELTVPQTDTGEQVEYTRALERTMSKELGKIPP